MSGITPVQAILMATTSGLSFTHNSNVFVCSPIVPGAADIMSRSLLPGWKINTKYKITKLCIGKYYVNILK